MSGTKAQAAMAMKVAWRGDMANSAITNLGGENAAKTRRIGAPVKRSRGGAALATGAGSMGENIISMA